MQVSIFLKLTHCLRGINMFMIHNYFTCCFNNDEAEGLWKLVLGYIPFLVWQVWVGNMSQFHGSQNCYHGWPTMKLQHEFVVKYRHPSHIANKCIANLPWVFVELSPERRWWKFHQVKCTIEVSTGKNKRQCVPKSKEFPYQQQRVRETWRVHCCGLAAC